MLWRINPHFARDNYCGGSTTREIRNPKNEIRNLPDLKSGNLSQDKAEIVPGDNREFLIKKPGGYDLP